MSFKSCNEWHATNAITISCPERIPLHESYCDFRYDTHCHSSGDVSYKSLPYARQKKWRYAFFASLLLHSCIFMGALIIGGRMAVIADSSQQKSSLEVTWFALSSAPTGGGKSVGSCQPSHARVDQALPPVSHTNMPSVVVPLAPSQEVTAKNAHNRHQPSLVTATTKSSSTKPLKGKSVSVAKVQQTTVGENLGESSFGKIGQASSGGGHGKATGYGIPQPIGNREPEYPLLARQRGQQGEVLLRVFVDEQGRVTSLHIERSSGYSSLDEAAVKAVQQWRFTPARGAHGPVAGEASLPVLFRLTNS